MGQQALSQLFKYEADNGGTATHEENTANPEVTPSPAVEKPETPEVPEVPETPETPETPEVPETPEPPLAAEADKSTEPVAYVPNYKYVAAGEDFEVPAFLRSVMTSQESEDQIRELLTKSHGLDAVKVKHEETKTRLGNLQGRFGNVESKILEVQEHYNRGDFDTFFKQLGIPKEKVYQWVQDKVTYQELPQEQRHVIDAQKTADLTAYQAGRQMEQQTHDADAREVEALKREMEVVFEMNDVKAFRSAFDTRLGREGAFMEQVRNAGDLAWTQKGEKWSMLTAVNTVMKNFGALVDGAPTVPPTTPPGAPTLPVVAPQKNTTPVIPNVKGGASTSPTGRPRVKSVADLHKRYEELTGVVS